MGEFAGVFQRDGGEVDPAMVDRLARSLAGVGKVRVWRGGSAVILHRPLRRSEAADTALLPMELASGAVVAADVRLDEPGEVARALGLDAGRPAGDAALVAAACERWGPGAAERLNGSFAFALWDQRARELTLARDALGTRPLFYVEQPRHILFASSLQSLLALPQTPRDLDDLILVQTLTIESQDQEQTLYSHIRRAPPGGMAVFGPRASRTARYWTIDSIAPIRLRRDDDYVEAARDLLDRAVASRLPRGGRIGTMLSGGLDSAGVSATVARLLGDGRFDAFHRAPGAPHPYETMDELALVRQVAARYPTIDLTVVDDMLQSAADIHPEIDAAAMCVPRARGLNATWFESLVTAAEGAGVDVLFSGGCGNTTLSWDGRPHFAGDLLRGRLGSVGRGIVQAARQQQRSVGSFLAAHFIKPLVPRAMLRSRYQRAAGRPLWATYSMVSEDFLEEVDYGRHAEEVGHDIPFKPPVDHRLSRLKSLQSQRNRDKTAFARRKWGHESVDPYADRRLVEFTLGIPQTQFWNAGQDRWLARRVLADRLPAALVQERRRGRQCPEWYEMVSRRREGMAEAIARIESSPLASRVVDVARMKALLDDWPKDAEAAKAHRQIYGIALSRGISIGGFLRWYEGGNG